jgi:hypothetical protein
MKYVLNLNLSGMNDELDLVIYRQISSLHSVTDRICSFLHWEVENKQTNKLRGFSPQSELHRPSDRRLSAKLVHTLADKGCRVVSATNPHGR